MRYGDGVKGHISATASTLTSIVFVPGSTPRVNVLVTVCISRPGGGAQRTTACKDSKIDGHIFQRIGIRTADFHNKWVRQRFTDHTGLIVT